MGKSISEIASTVFVANLLLVFADDTAIVYKLLQFINVVKTHILDEFILHNGASQRKKEWFLKEIFII